MKHIITMDYAYIVRFYRLNKKTGVNEAYKFKSFAFSNYESEESALRAAKRWRNEEAKTHNPIANGGDFISGKYFKNTRSNNTTGVVGVRHREGEETESGGFTVSRFIAGWKDYSGDYPSERSESFSYLSDVEKKAAFKKACKLRKQMEKLHYIGAVA